MKQIDRNKIIKENSSTIIEFAGTELYYKEDAVKKMIRAGIEQALEMAEQKTQDLFAENASDYDGRLITPTLVKKEILSIKERIK